MPDAPIPAAAGPIFLGLDTGGTYTDAVLWDEGKGRIVAKAKALTTRHDLSIGIAGAAERVIEAAGVEPEAVKLVSMSTTLATNALVEGQGGRVALVMIGFTPADLERDGLKTALGTDPLLFCSGGHDVHGNGRPLDLSSLQAALPDLARTVSGFAVCAYFATRNPAHEIAARAMIQGACAVPVTASHELSSKLGGPRRALTTLLNARLVGTIDRLIAATTSFLAVRSIQAPLMVVRGDGALVSAAWARNRPIETILSGPAASLVGARHMTGLSDCIVSDIGGTTTDVAVLDSGRPRLDPEGATVGGFRTMVEAVAMRTFGLGGDSEVALSEHGLTPKLTLGPRRLVPLSLLGVAHADQVSADLERQLRSPNPGRLDGRFAIRTGLPDAFAAGLAPAEARLYESLDKQPVALDRLLSSTAQVATLNRLVSRGLVHISGFTPSDAAHVLNHQLNWNAAIARLGAELFARKRDGRGAAVAASPEDLSERVLQSVTFRSAELILETVLAEDGLEGAATADHPLLQRALKRQNGIARLFLNLDRPVVGLGASAPLHYASLEPLLGTRCIVPPDTDVANALGAVVGQVRVSVEAQVSQPREGLFRVSTGSGVADFLDEEAAMAAAEAQARTGASESAGKAGAAEVEVEISRDVQAVTIEGRRTFISARLTASATGRPRIAA